jgi:hypothetical protein
MIYVGDIGVKIEMSVNIDVSLISLAKFVCRKPNGRTVEWVAQIDATNGILYYITQEGDLNISGEYKIQPYVEMGDFKGRGEPAILRVYD